MKIEKVGNGEVKLIAGGGKIFTDVAARFVGSERSIDDILASPYDKKLVENILSSGHRAATEFDYFVFAIGGYARVSEVQLVRKRLASYMIKTGRAEKKGKRSFDVVLPEDITSFKATAPVSGADLYIPSLGKTVQQLIGMCHIDLSFDASTLLGLTEEWYNFGLASGKKEEELRYMKQQATEFKAIIGMNAHALCDWFQIRCCKNAQTEIRDMASKMLTLCKDAAPDLFKDAGPSCKVLGYCPENCRQHEDCKGKIITKGKAMEVLKNYVKEQK